MSLLEFEEETYLNDEMNYEEETYYYEDEESKPKGKDLDRKNAKNQYIDEDGRIDDGGEKLDDSDE